MKLDIYQRKLDIMAHKHLRRVLDRADGINFSSNDYLALSIHPYLVRAAHEALDRGVPVGATGSRLLRGNHAEHEALEREAAEHFGAPRMLYFSSGYAANMAALSTLAQPNDLIVYDELIHASVHAGMRLARAPSIAARHNDPSSFDQIIQKWRQDGGCGTPWVVTESLYSMDGDRAPLTDLYDITGQYEGVLYVDEAHATGVYGAHGAGLAHSFAHASNVMTLHTCGKALAGSGALLGAHPVLCDYVVNRASHFIFTTAPSPLQAAVLREALRIVKNQPELRSRLQAHIHYANQQLQSRTGRTTSGSQIIPIIVGNNGLAVQLATQIQAAGFDVRAVRPPTVPHGTARLRLSITLHTTQDDIDRMMDTLSSLLTKISV